MGSAAPSHRRWLVVPLVALAGVAAVALGGRLLAGGESGPPALGSESASDGDGRSSPRSPAIATVPVDLESGWAVPDLGGGGDHGLPPGVEAGTPTVGAAVPVAPGAPIVLLHGPVPRQLAYRVQGADGWSEWAPIHIEQDEGPDDLPEGADPAAGPFWLGRDATGLEFAVLGGDASAFELTFLAGGDGDPELDPAGAAIGQQGQGGRPPIIGREQWADADWNYRSGACDEGPSVAEHVQAVVIHHTVTSNGYGEGDVDDLLRAIRYGHVEVNGWCDIGYNFVVDRFGRIWEARTGSADRSIIGGHARGFNTGTVGIALLGQHQPGASPAATAPSAAAQAAVEDLAHWKLEAEGVDPAGRTWLRNRSDRPPQRLAGLAWHHVPTILGHRDLGVTSCPGDHGVALVRSLPDRLAARRDTTLPYRFADWRAHGHGPGFVVADARGGIRPAGVATPWSQAPAGLAGSAQVVAVGGTLAGGYLLSATGELVGYGAAPAIGQRPAGDGQPVDLVVRSDGTSGWVLSAAGVLHGFGGMGDLDDARSAAGAGPVAASLDDDGRGWVLGRDGSLTPVGGAPATTTGTAPSSDAAAIDLDHRPDGGGWVLDDAGRLHGFGGAPSTHVEPPAAVRAVVAARNGTGGWVLDADGQLWPFGGARLVFPVSTDASAGHAVDVDHTGSVYSPEFLGGGDARYIGGLYQLFLGRQPSPEEVDLRVSALEQGARRLDLTTELSRSAHWSGSAVDDLYRAVLGRPPDPDGRAYWMGEIGAGLQLQDLGTYFYGSDEYARRAGSTEAYVTTLYHELLGRPPDGDGLRYWTDLLATGAARPADVANGFYASVESRRDRAAALHQRIFSRQPSVEEREAWAERLAALGDGGLAAEMAASAQYYHLAVDGPDP